MEKYETITQLGAGSFATVIKAKELNTGDIVAIKIFKKKYSDWNECRDLREVKSLNKLKHENIIRIKEMIHVDDTLHMVFEFMEKDLYNMYKERQNKKFNEGQIRCIMYQALQGIAYMHKYGFFHRDLKPENLLVNGETVKLADFGLAREIRSLPPYTDYVSTRWYRAPECILRSTNYNSPVDIWAMGCIMAELYNFSPLFFGNSEKDVLSRMCNTLGTPNSTTWPEGLALAKKINCKFLNFPGIPLSQLVPDASKEAIDLMYEMLKWDPSKRGTAASLLQHTFFTKYPIPNRISTPEYSNTNTSGNGFKTYKSKNHNQKNTQLSNSQISSITKSDDDFMETGAFNKCIIIYLYIFSN